MGTKTYALHEDDVQELQRLRDTLRGLRLDAGLSQVAVERQAGLNGDFISALERGTTTAPLLSTLQAWGRALGVRVEFEVQDLWRFHHHDQQFHAAFRLSRPWDADVQARAFVVAATRQWRIARQLDVEHLAPLLGQAGDTIRVWELQSHDPLVSRVMAQLRVSGTRLRIRTFTREQWIFG